MNIKLKHININGIDVINGENAIIFGDLTLSAENGRITKILLKDKILYSLKNKNIEYYNEMHYR